MYTKRALEERKMASPSLISDDETNGLDDKVPLKQVVNDSSDYVPTSPNRYDYQKNVKKIKNRMEENGHHTQTSNGGDMKMEMD